MILKLLNSRMGFFKEILIKIIKKKEKESFIGITDNYLSETGKMIWWKVKEFYIYLKKVFFWVIFKKV
jgi:hypothetical protein